jgi:hypothetical protein
MPFLKGLPISADIKLDISGNRNKNMRQILKARFGFCLATAVMISGRQLTEAENDWSHG